MRAPATPTSRPCSQPHTRVLGLPHGEKMRRLASAAILLPSSRTRASTSWKPFLLGAVKINRRLGLPWWGPFYLARRIFDRMPCVLLELKGAPVERLGPPPAISPPRLARNQRYAEMG